MVTKKSTKKTANRAEKKPVKKTAAAKTAAKSEKIVLTLTKKASDKLKEIIKQEKKDGSYIRLYAQEGCCGAHYGMDFDDKAGKSDITLEQHGITLVMQKSIVPLLQGISIDFVKSEHTEGFRIDTQKESKTCGESCHCC